MDKPTSGSIRIVLFVLSILTCVPAPARDQLRPLSNVQVDLSIAQAGRAIGEATAQNLDEDALASFRGTRDELFRKSLELRDNSINPFVNAIPDETYIVNGVPTFSFGATGALLKLDEEGVFRVKCSGTMVGCETFLTARHCVESSLDAGDYRVFLQAEGLLSVAGFLPKHDDYAPPIADLQLVRLDKAISAVVPARINENQNVTPSIVGTIVGFGYTSANANDHGLKRFGSVATHACLNSNGSLGSYNRNAFICWLFDKKKETTCNFDSGGPLFPGILDSDGTLAGVTSRGDISCLTDSEYVDVNVRYFAPWLKQNGGSDVGRMDCSDMNYRQAGSFESLADSNKMLQTGSPYDYDPIDIPANTTEVRVALNAEDRQENDLDLRVVVNRVDGSTREQCNLTDPSNFASCIFEPGTRDSSIVVYVAQKGTGSGKYQLLVSMLTGADRR